MATAEDWAADRRDLGLLGLLDVREHVRCSLIGAWINWHLPQEGVSVTCHRVCHASARAVGACWEVSQALFLPWCINPISE